MALFSLLFLSLVHNLFCSPLMKASRLRNWINEQGGVVHSNIDVEMIYGGYGLRTSSNGYILNGETLIALPAHLCLSSSNNNNDVALHEIAVNLLTERSKGKGSFFESLIDTLPEDCSYIPALWSDDKLKEYRGTSIAADARVMRDSWSSQYYEKCDSKWGEGDYLWARATLQGRAYSFATSKTNTLISLLPFISFANHDDNLLNGAKEYPEIGNGVTFPATTIILRARKKYYPGQAILTSYGELSFQQKLLSFGWVDESLSLGSFGITAFALPEHGKTAQIEIKTSLNGKDDKLMNIEVSNAINVVSNSLSCTVAEAADVIKEILERRIMESKRRTGVEHHNDVSTSPSTIVRKIETQSANDILQFLNSKSKTVSC